MDQEGVVTFCGGKFSQMGRRFLRFPISFFCSSLILPFSAVACRRPWLSATGHRAGVFAELAIFPKLTAKIAYVLSATCFHSEFVDAPLHDIRLVYNLSPGGSISIRIRE
jgi:hypothetical protein